MADKLRAFGEFTRQVLRAETLSVPGRVNLFGLGVIFLLVVGGGLLDVVQALVRVWKPTYDTGLRSLLSFVVTYGLLLLLCVLLLVVADRPRRQD